MHFEVLTEMPERMYPGLIIGYKVRPLAGIPMHWVTEITHVKKNEFFVDEQRIGPLAFWHHQHFFAPSAGGVLMSDIVTYRLPYGLLGKLIESFFIRNRVKSIFEYRRARMLALFS